MSDEGFHEIQLNGKQLVFLFMAATVVSVVIFLCGVMVGRGVRDRAVSAASSDPADAASVSATPSAPAAGDSPTTAGTPAAQPPVQAAAPPTDQTPPTPGEEEGDDDYYNQLVKDQKDTSLAPKGRAPSPAPKTPAKASERAKSPEPPPARKTTPAAAVSPPAGAPAAVAERGQGATGYAVQLVAVRERGEADAIAKRLVAKGYQAYVLVPEPGKPPVYRVQVGRFKSRGDADKVAARLRREEQFKPWVTR
jgi:cell division septation protein DedD